MQFAPVAAQLWRPRHSSAMLAEAHLPKARASTPGLGPRCPSASCGACHMRLGASRRVAIRERGYSPQAFLMSPPEPPSDAAQTAPLAACSPEAPTCCGALRSLCGPSPSAAAMSHQAPPAPSPKPGESGAGAKDGAGTTSAEPLDPNAREALRSAFFAGASTSTINDVYALGATIGAFASVLRGGQAHAR